MTTDTSLRLLDEAELDAVHGGGIIDAIRRVVFTYLVLKAASDAAAQPLPSRPDL